MCRGDSVIPESHVNIEKLDHSVSLDNVNILTSKNKKFEREVKEAIHIRIVAPSLNKDDGCFLLPAVWMNLLKARFWATQSQNCL